MTTGQTTDRRRQPSRNLPLNRASNKTQIWLAIYHDLIVTRAVLATAELLVFFVFFPVWSRAKWLPVSFTAESFSYRIGRQFQW